MALLLGAIGFFHGGLGFLKTRKGNANLEETLGVQVEKMVLAANRFVRDVLLIEELAELGVVARVISLPEGTQTVVGGLGALARKLRFADRRRCGGQLPNQRDIAICADGKAWTIFGFALGAEHGAREFTIRG